jgi:flavin reductase (DIM6/NTAB) family NADH-FMN oxidoreductase RutF
MDMSSAQAQRDLRKALGAFPTGVTVITTHAPEGQGLVGLTVNSFSSVSLDPPLVLWSISNRSANISHFSTGSEHAIHVLSSQQEALALQFATPKTDKFAGVSHQVPDDFGAPCIEGCAARFDCVTESVIPAGDHQIILARVLRYETGPETPLLFARGAFAAAVPAPLAPAKVCATTSG